MKVSIIIPVYNEEKTIRDVLDKISILDLRMKKEIILVDDGSIDHSSEIIKNFIIKNKRKDIEYVYLKKKNKGKGSALRIGFKEATGEIIIIQDADLEYDPRDFVKLIKPIKEEKELVVYGSRFLKRHKPLYKIYFLGNKVLSFLTGLLYNEKITDMETCYKVFKADIIRSIPLKSNGFDIEPEMTAKILKRKINIKEIPISYSPRSLKEGKKINWKDGIKAIYVLLYLRFFN